MVELSPTNFSTSGTACGTACGTPPATRQDIVDAVQQIFAFAPREAQVNSLLSLVDGKDTILYAPTSAGKSLVGQIFPKICPGWVLCIIPLTRLGDEQVRKVNALPGLQGFLLHDDTNSASGRRQLMEALGVQRCTHCESEEQQTFRRSTITWICEKLSPLYITNYAAVFTSPEIAISSLFKSTILAKPSIVSRLRLVVVDELHCVMAWGDSFRPGYRQLHVLRNRLSPDIPWFGASATLRPLVLSNCLRQGGFKTVDTEIIYQNLNRPNIYCDLRQMQYSASSVKDLLFLFPPPQGGLDVDNFIRGIPKTVIFMKSTDIIHSSRYRLVIFLHTRYNIAVSTGKDIVQGFYSTRSEDTKTRLYEKFLDPSSPVRIILATDAVGMGMDFPRLEIVVQWDIVDNLDILMQRLGRAGRDISLEAHFVWFIPPNLLPDNSVGGIPQIQSSQPEESSQTKTKTVTSRKKRVPAPKMEQALVEFRSILKLDRCLPSGTMGTLLHP